MAGLRVWIVVTYASWQGDQAEKAVGQAAPPHGPWEALGSPGRDACPLLFELLALSARPGQNVTEVSGGNAKAQFAVAFGEQLATASRARP